MSTTVVPVSEDPVTNPLFLEAMDRVPVGLSTSNPPSFTTVFSPFVTTAFARGFASSGGGVGPLGVAFSLDGASVFISGGEGRNLLWRFDAGGGTAVSPLAALDVPIYDMAFDGAGRLWATTGGGPLVRIDPATGAIVERYGDGIQLGLAVHPESGKIYVATGRGVEIFDPETEEFTPFSSTRLHGVAFDPEGVLYGVTWPDDGYVVRFDQRGNAEIVLIPSTACSGIAFGLEGSPLEGLMFLSHPEGGSLTMVDTVTMKSVDVAQGGTRGDFIHVSPDGRLFVTQSSQVDTFAAVTPPKVLATSPVNGMQVLPVVRSATIRFDQDMKRGSPTDQGSVLNPFNYRLVNTDTGRVGSITNVRYEASTRTATVNFEALEAGSYTLTVYSSVKSELGMALTGDVEKSFTVMVDVTGSVTPVFSMTRFNPADRVVSFEVSLTNTLDFDLLEPWRLVFTGIKGTSAQVTAADGVTGQGYQYVLLAGPEGGVLSPGESTGTRTVTIHNPDFLAFDLISRVNVEVAANQVPVISSSAVNTAQLGEEYVYDIDGTDPEGSDLTYMLVTAPRGAGIDPVTGLINWTPEADSPSTARFEARAYDARGGFGVQVWDVSVSGVNSPPQVLPISDLEVEEGEWVVVPVAAVDADGDTLCGGRPTCRPGRCSTRTPWSFAGSRAEAPQESTETFERTYRTARPKPSGPSIWW